MRAGEASRTPHSLSTKQVTPHGVRRQCRSPSRIRTCGRRVNSSLPYHLATGESGQRATRRRFPRCTMAYATYAEIGARPSHASSQFVTSIVNELGRVRRHTSAVDPGAGLEPALRGPEPRVLPLDDPGTDTSIFLSRSEGSRTLGQVLKRHLLYH